MRVSKAIVSLCLTVTLMLMACTPQAKNITGEPMDNTGELKSRIAMLEAQVQSLTLENQNPKSKSDAEQIALLQQQNQQLSDNLTRQHLRMAELVESWPLEKLNKEEVLHRFVLALQKGDGAQLLSLYSKRLAAGASYPEITPRKIKTISIAPYPDNPEQLLLEFEMVDDGLPFWAGPHCFFPRFVFEDNRWKIDALPTSP